jgi:dihydroorotase
MKRNILLKGGHVIDPSQRISRVLDVIVRNGTIAELGECLIAEEEMVTRDLGGQYVCPGLIDLHGHWYEGSAFGIDPNLCLQRGTTTVVDAGTAGFVNFLEFRRHCISTSRIRVLAFVNIAACGIPVAFAGELDDLRYSRPRETAAMLEENRDVALGVKVRMREGHNPNVLDQALEAARKCRAPLMVHISPGANTPNILKHLRAGDILTHCFEGRGDGILVNGRLLPEAAQARKEGVVFDVGHGSASFSWAAARKAFEYEFYPDTISTDLHRYSIERWAFDMPTTMTKFLHLGMALEDVILKSTYIPAKVIGREGELGTLRTGTVADLFTFAIEEGEFPLEDTHLRTEIAKRKIKPVFAMRGGEIIEAYPRSDRLRHLNDSDFEVVRYIEQSA